MVASEFRARTDSHEDDFNSDLSVDPICEIPVCIVKIEPRQSGHGLSVALM